LTHFLPYVVAQIYVSGVIQTSLELTFTVTYDPELDFLKENCVMSADWRTRDSLPPFLSCTEICVHVIKTSLQLTVTLICDPELDFLKQKWVMSSERSTLDSLRPFLPWTKICVRGITDISGINSYGYI
jgi:hypothetical protein